NANDEEQQQQMEGIFICADVWLEVFAFLDPFELGLKMALISDRFDALVGVHFKSRKWSLGPIPNKVIGFKGIRISYVDQTVIEFLRRMRPLFDSSGTNVFIGTYDQSRSWEIIWQKIWPLVTDNICCLLLHSFQLDRLRQFSPAILPNCANLRSIQLFEPLLEFPDEANADAASRQAVAKWLLTPRGDGLPKMFYCRRYSAEIDGLIGSFRNASEPVNFIIRLRPSFFGIEPLFELENNLTRERLTLRQMDNEFWLLVRCPIGREEDKWAVWEKEAIEWKWNNSHWNCISINFDDRDIGDGMVEAKAGPSEPKKPKK
uniref:F-box domain-containing protein n=1 Tax=Globodera pallida TaxID=36090 RepID=A0A183BMH9_GLOPA